ncbi:tRNA preQ1(34) S-adenosylmethionine ribosyltransferase-isomerase QueA [Candidatus Symbiobacter mobilis]|uniref:S-adenosylmethionine:tRNA ribosyltransferase-isomerase n=1 Tax=Candidatus Symbiobacter mobilis CR TaxID=946483 RepID=U5NB44_9BURK|nr:tRNA preQ1(34) S-adenosylmethionine ribosyltransferase-isomerase QueA [Candidatus Symbiobacter mobilis]AGX87384.1 S-adenosylmethionine:tRNA ribosyltransferase-isomerase [Candidatus Symbiobacter mobilis CR]
MPPLTLEDVDFDLPADRIAQYPAAQRSQSRLLDASGSTMVDRVFDELPTLLREGDLLVCNDTRVLRARLYGHKPTGGQIELLVERVLGGQEVAAHLRCRRKPQPGAQFSLVSAHHPLEPLHATMLGRWPDEHGPLFRLALHDEADSDPYAILERHGHVPLPPYIARPDAAPDDTRYQSVFARSPGAIAAPTASLHFDEALLQRLDDRGIERAFLTLHVGAGTFQPVQCTDVSQHRMHSEWYEVPAATREAVAACRRRNGRVVAVGTTCVRALESWAHTGQPQGETRLFILPGFDFRTVDLLVTNFHLPHSTLLMLVAAFAGLDRIRVAYRHAIDNRYRFFSYGDAMLLARMSSTTLPTLP